MSVRVRIPTPLRSATDGESELSSEAATVSSLIEKRCPTSRFVSPRTIADTIWS